MKQALFVFAGGDVDVVEFEGFRDRKIDFEGGGRILMDFTDLDSGEVEPGTAMEMVFRIKDTDERRHFTRYFWKATPARGDLSPTG